MILQMLLYVDYIHVHLQNCKMHIMLLVYPLEDGIEHIGMAGEVNALRFLLCYLFIVLLFFLKENVHLQL